MNDRERLIAEIDSLVHQVEALRRKAGGLNLEVAADLGEAGEFLDDARLSLVGQGLTDR